jgi:hypothetical protein
MFKKLSVAILIILLSSLLFVGIASASEGDGISTYTTIPEAPTPSPTPNTNSTNTNSTNTNSTNTSTNSNDTITAGNTTYVYVGADQIQSINPNGAPLSFSTYNNTQVSLVFASALSCGVNASGGHWTASQDSAGQIVIFPDEIGTYRINFQVLYNRVVNQTISLTIYSGDSSPPTVINLAIINSGFTLDLDLNVMVLPHAATPQEMWDYGYGSFQNSIDSATEKMAEQQAATDLKTNITIAVAAVIAIVLVLVLLNWKRLTIRMARVENREWT